MLLSVFATGPFVAMLLPMMLAFLEVSKNQDSSITSRSAPTTLVSSTSSVTVIFGRFVVNAGRPTSRLLEIYSRLANSNGKPCGSNPVATTGHLSSSRRPALL